MKKLSFCVCVAGERCRSFIDLAPPSEKGEYPLDIINMFLNYVAEDSQQLLILKNNVAVPDTVSEVLFEREEGRDSILYTLYWVIKSRRNNKA